MDISAHIIFFLELIGTIAFAASGAMTGIRRDMDVFGVCVLGVITAVGGGMTRDVILGYVPGALTNPVYVSVAVVASLAVFGLLLFQRNIFEETFGIWYNQIMLVMDSLGLGIFTVMGVMVGVDRGYEGNLFLLAFLGTLTGVGGGLLRDVLAEQPPYILHRHIYACASVLGAVCCVLVYRFAGRIPGVAVGSAAVVIIRFLAVHYRWNLPQIKAER